MSGLPMYEKKGIVLLVQVDHLSGETIGTVIDDLYEAGAHNVQVLSSITKKNRPGYVFLIDGNETHLAAIEQIILLELGATGWHLLHTGHRHTATRSFSHRVTFATPDGPLELTAKFKAVKARPEMLRPEHASCLEIRQALRQHGVVRSLDQVRQDILFRIHADAEKYAEHTAPVPEVKS